MCVGALRAGAHIRAWARAWATRTGVGVGAGDTRTMFVAPKHLRRADPIAYPSSHAAGRMKTRRTGSRGAHAPAPAPLVLASARD